MNSRKLWRRASARLWQYWDWNTFPSEHNAGLSYFFHTEWIHALPEAHKPRQVEFFGSRDDVIVVEMDGGRNDK